MFGVEEHLAAEAAAGRAGAIGVVEGKDTRLDFLDREAGDRAGEFGGVHGSFLAVRILHRKKPVGEIESRFDGIGKPPLYLVIQDDAIDHHVNMMLDLLVEFRHFLNIIDFAIDLDALEPALSEIEKFLAVFTFAAANDGRHQVKPLTRAHGHDLINHLADGLARNWQARRRGIGHADARIEQAQVIIDFRHRADGGAGIL